MSEGYAAEAGSPTLGDPRESCFFAFLGWGPCRLRFDGRLDRCHLIEKQRLRQAGIENLWDERLWVPGCRHHHGLFDRKLRPLSLADYPPKLLAFAEAEGFAFVDERTGWVKNFDKQREESAA
jgi:hypothetical protein